MKKRPKVIRKWPIQKRERDILKRQFKEVPQFRELGPTINTGVYALGYLVMNDDVAIVGVMTRGDDGSKIFFCFVRRIKKWVLPLAFSVVAFVCVRRS